MRDIGAGVIGIVIVGMALTNFTVRYVPLAVLSRFELPAGVRRWLSFVPISVMGALVASEVVRPSGEWRASLDNPGIYAAILAGVAFRFTRSFLGATVIGVVSFVVLRGAL